MDLFLCVQLTLVSYVGAKVDRPLGQTILTSIKQVLSEVQEAKGTPTGTGIECNTPGVTRVPA
jgi:hypothetical protein